MAGNVEAARDLADALGRAADQQERVTRGVEATYEALQKVANLNPPTRPALSPGAGLVGSGGGGGGGAGSGFGGDAAAGAAAPVGGSVPEGSEVYFESLRKRGCRETSISIPDPAALFPGASTITVRGLVCPFDIEATGTNFIIYPGQRVEPPRIGGRTGGGAGGGSGGGGGRAPAFAPTGTPASLDIRAPITGGPTVEQGLGGGKSLTVDGAAIVGELRKLGDTLRPSPADRRAASEGLY